MCTTLFFVAPDFTKTIILECDVLGYILGAILMNDGHPLAFTDNKKEFLTGNDTPNKIKKFTLPKNDYK